MKLTLLSILMLASIAGVAWAMSPMPDEPAMYQPHTESIDSVSADGERLIGPDVTLDTAQFMQPDSSDPDPVIACPMRQPDGWLNSVDIGGNSETPHIGPPVGDAQIDDSTTWRPPATFDRSNWTRQQDTGPIKRQACPTPASYTQRAYSV